MFNSAETQSGAGNKGVSKGEASLACEIDKLQKTGP